MVAVAGFAAGCSQSAPPKKTAATKTAEDIPNVQDDPKPEPEPPQPTEPQPREPAPQEPKFRQPICRLLIYLPQGPLVVETHVTVHGKSLGEFDAELIEHCLSGLDADGAGYVTWEQLLAARGMQAAQDVQPNRNVGQEERDALKRQYDLNHNDRVDRSEAEAYVYQRGDTGAGLVLLNDGSTDQGAGTVWRLLDTDANRVLSAEELAAAAAQLKTLDADDNDVLQLEELDRNRALSASRGQMANADVTRGPARVANLGVAAPWDAIIYDLQTRYQQDNRLAVDRYPLAARFLQLDQRANGRLDRSEIEGLNTVEPHLVLRLAFGAAAAADAATDAGTAPETRLSIERAAPELKTARKITRDRSGRPTADLPEIGLRFTLLDVEPTDFAALARQQLAALDADSNGYLEKSELPDASLPVPFAALDANEDGKLYPDELVPYVKRQFAAGAGRIQVRISSRSDSTFAALDSDRDGQLSHRETLQAAARLRELAGGSETVSLDRLPHFLDLEFSTQGTAAAAVRQQTRGPRWFARMDSNSDGDISPREFLGTAEQFVRLDANADGFIDAAEAEPPADNR